MKKNLLLATFFGFTSCAFADREIKEPPVSAGTKAEKTGFSYSVSADVSTTGFGGTLGWELSKHFGIRAGVHGIEYSLNRLIGGNRYDASLRLLTEQIILDYMPWADYTFRISGGIVFNQNELNGTATPGAASTFTLGGTQYSAASVGVVKATVKQPAVGGYFGLGGDFFLGISPHWSAGIDVGVIFSGNPSIKLARSGGIASSALDAAVVKETPIAQSKIDGYQFWPVGQMSLNIHFETPSYG